MRDNDHGFRARALAQAEELIAAIASAETVIAETIERECEALRSGRILAAKALHMRVCDAARLYLQAMRAAQASIWTMDQVMPGCRRLLEDRRAAFSSVLKVELAVLATERAVFSQREAAVGATEMAAAEPPRDDARKRAALRLASSRRQITPQSPPPRRSAR